MLTIVAFILIILVVFLLLQGKLALPSIFIIFPIIAALICGFNLTQISEFIAGGFSTVLNVAILFTFSIMFFSIMADAGLFDVLVKKITRYLGNNVTVALIITALVACIAQVEGSGSTTMLITIPAMLPIITRMKIRKEAMLLVIFAASGVVNLIPWSSAMVRVSTVTGIEAGTLWKGVLPVQIVALILVFIMVFFVGKYEKKNGAGISNEEFALLKDKLSKQKANITVSKKVFIFDVVLLFAVIVALLTEILPANVLFMIGTAIALPVNFPVIKEQKEKMKHYGATAMNMVVTLFSIGVFLGILQNSKMINEMAGTLITIMPEWLGPHIVFMVALFAVPLVMVLGSDTIYFALMPILIELAANYGIGAQTVASGLLVGVNVGVGISLVIATPYLALGLAGVEMRDSVKYCFKWMWPLSIFVVIIAAILGVIPF